MLFFVLRVCSAAASSVCGLGRYGCTGSANDHGAASPDPPRAKEWDMDFGEPASQCT